MVGPLNALPMNWRQRVSQFEMLFLLYLVMAMYVSTCIALAGFKSHWLVLVWGLLWPLILTIILYKLWEQIDDA